MNKFAIGAAILLGLCSAYFSIIGLAQIFHGSFWAVIIMGISLELGKFATALFVHRHWAKLGFLKAYLAIATLVLMVLTSAGIFGFLAKSSQTVAAPIAAQQTRLAYIETQISAIDTQRQRQEDVLKNLDGLVGIYTTQQKFEDARVGVRLFSRQKAQRQEAENAIKKLNADEQVLLQEKLTIDQKIQSVELEVGPAVYIAQALYGGKDISSVENAIRVVIFLIIFAFDPLAIALLIGAQKVYVRDENTPVVFDIEADISHNKNELQTDGDTVAANDEPENRRGEFANGEFFEYDAPTAKSEYSGLIDAIASDRGIDRNVRRRRGV